MMSESSAAKVWRVPSSEHPLLNVSYLAFLCVTLVLSGQMTARKRSHEMAERVITLDTMHSTDTTELSSWSLSSSVLLQIVKFK